MSAQARPVSPMARPSGRTWALVALQLVAAALGFAAGYGFGLRAGGTWLAFVAAANGAVFCSLLVDGLAARWARREGQRRR